MSEIEEREANQFAMCLLMPEEFVREEVKKLGKLDLLDDRKTIKLARKFEVPATLMAMRLAQIFEKP